jgi:hypothetical protein
MSEYRRNDYVNFYASNRSGGDTDPAAWTTKSRIVASDNAIAHQLLMWSGLHALWHYFALEGMHDFFREIAVHCSGVHWREDQVRLDQPKASVSVITVFIDQPETARKQMLQAVEWLIDRYEAEDRR